jgi:hypothetical protein
MKLRPLLLGLLSSLLVTTAIAQTTAMPAAQAADLFNFWIGDWNVTWDNADGTKGHGHNRVIKLMDGAVIEENFEEAPDAPPPRLIGKSLTVQEKTSGKWRQSWVDNQGGYFAFTASVDGDKRIFATDARVTNGKSTIQRMVFHDIRQDAFTWDWESSTDGGSTWSLHWRIHYSR